MGTLMLLALMHFALMPFVFLPFWQENISMTKVTCPPNAARSIRGQSMQHTMPCRRKE
jgi:hypothetical protein